jgi:hypothetical protein
MKNKNFPIIVAVVLPIIFVIVIAFVAYIPNSAIKPQYNFIYITSTGVVYGSTNYSNMYDVENGHIALEPQIVLPNETNVQNAPKLYLYDVKDNSSHEITLVDAHAYTLDPGPSSPDGYTINYEYGEDGALGVFGSDNEANTGYFIEKDSGRKKLSALSNNSYNDFKLIGWVK